MNQDQLNKLVKLITVCATAFIVLLVGIIAFQRIKFARLQNEVDDVDSQIEALNYQQSELKTDIENSNSQLYIEEMLRNKLIIKDNETYFQIDEQ